MGKLATIEIIESLKELELLFKKTKRYNTKQRIGSLILTKKNKDKTRQEISVQLGVGVRTLYNWMQIYQREGLDRFLTRTSGGAHNIVIPEAIKVGLEKKLNNSTAPLQGYTDAVQWVKDNYGIEINYHTLRSFMIVKFGSKLKVPRKSHYKKDEEEFEAFKKTFHNS